MRRIFALVSFIAILCFPQGLAAQDRPAIPISIHEAVEGAVGRFDRYCDGYGSPGARGVGYVSVLTLSIGTAKKNLDDVLDSIVAYDASEASDAYIGQINMLYASSFSGPQGAIWGYDVAKAGKLANREMNPLFMKKWTDGSDIPVYSVDPLLDAGKRLFGTRDERRFRMLPGSHVACAAKVFKAKGPTVIWCAIGIAIAEDRSNDASLFIEDGGEFKGKTQNIESYFSDVLQNIAEAALRCGKNQNVKYKEIYVGYKRQDVPEGHIGVALPAVPYVVLARDAAPKNGAARLINMSIADWEKEMGFQPFRSR